MIDKVNLAEKFSLFDERWSPKVVAELNDTQVKLVRPEGEFVWHHHDDEDDDAERPDDGGDEREPAAGQFLRAALGELLLQAAPLGVALFVRRHAEKSSGYGMTKSPAVYVSAARPA